MNQPAMNMWASVLVYVNVNVKNVVCECKCKCKCEMYSRYTTHVFLLVKKEKLSFFSSRDL